MVEGIDQVQDFEEKIALDESDSWSDLSCENFESESAGEEEELFATSLEVQNVILAKFMLQTARHKLLCFDM